MVWATFGVILGGRLGWDLIYGIGLCSVSPDADFCRGLPYGVSHQPHQADRGLGRRHVVPWRLAGRGDRGLAVLPQTQAAFSAMADLACAFAPLGLFFGRIANFVNGELWGRVTDVPWAMVFPRGGPLPRHPSQLYEAALEGILLFILVQIAMRAFRAQDRPGLISAIFFLGYGTFRFICEFFREPDAPFLGPDQHGHGVVDPGLAGRGIVVRLSPSRPGK